MPRVEPAFSMYLRLVLALGVTFQLPTIVLFLARLGVVTPRLMIRHFKYAVLIIVWRRRALTGRRRRWHARHGWTGDHPLHLSIGLAWMFGKKRTPEVEEAS